MRPSGFTSRAGTSSGRSSRGPRHRNVPAVSDGCVAATRAAPGDGVSKVQAMSTWTSSASPGQSTQAMAVGMRRRSSFQAMRMSERPSAEPRPPSPPLRSQAWTMTGPPFAIDPQRALANLESRSQAFVARRIDLA